MIFLDTSEIYALADVSDSNHDKSVGILQIALQSGQPIITHSYILVESAALLQRRLGLGTALAFLEEAKGFEVIWIDKELHDQAVQQLRNEKTSKLSLVDALSFVIMRREGICSYLGFDKHFDNAGFRRYPD